MQTDIPRLKLVTEKLPQLKPIDLSSLLSFLDRFEKVRPWELHLEDHHQEHKPDEEVAFWDVKHANALEVSFFTKSKERLMKILASIGMKWRVHHEDKHLYLHYLNEEEGKEEEKNAKASLTHGEVRLLISEVEKEVEKEGNFDYIAFVDKNLQAGIQLIRELRADAHDLIDARVTPQPIEPCEVI